MCENGENKTHTAVSERTFQRIGREEFGISHKRAYERLTRKWDQSPCVAQAQPRNEDAGAKTCKKFACFIFSATDEFKSGVIKFRNKAQRMNKHKLVFVDVTGIQEQAHPTHGLDTPDI